MDYVVNHGLQWPRWVSCVCLSNFVFSPLWPYSFFCSISQWCCTVNLIQSLSINTPHTVVCKFVLLKWYMAYIRSAVFCISIHYCHPNCCHSLPQVILTESTVILTSWLSILNNAQNQLLNCLWTVTQGRFILMALICSLT